MSHQTDEGGIRIFAQRVREPHGRRLTAFIAASVLGLGLSPSVSAAPSDVLGVSDGGRAISAVVLGDPDAATRIVVLGQMHGNEPAGRRVIKALRNTTAPPGTAIWLITSMNPDGHAAKTRANARGVDLNRNFPTQWRAAGSGTSQWSGPRAGSEPETRAMMRFLRAVNPTAVVSFHQPLGVVDITHPQAREAGRRLAQWMNLPARVVRCSGPCRGTLTEWVTDTFDAIAITVELPGTVTAADVDRAATSTERLARWLSRSRSIRG